MTCKSAKGASARLICADPDLAALDSKLAIAFQDAKVAALPDVQKLLGKEQQSWTRERNQKCGLTGKDNAPIRVPLSGKQCVVDAIEARIAELQHRPQAASISQAPASNGQDVPPRDGTHADSISQAPAPNGQDVPPRDGTHADSISQAPASNGQDVPPRDGTHADSISQPAALIGRNVIINPLVLPTGSIGPGGAGPNELPTFQELHFSVPTEGIGGIISCSVQSTLQAGDPLTNTPLQGKWIVKIAIDDDASSYRLFENDAWAPVLDDLRNAVHSACASALKTGRLRDAANEPVSELNDVFAAYSPRGLFLAYSIGQNTSWTLKTNLPKARKKVKTNLGIQTWVDPSQLTRNPYFFKGSLVGMVIQFDRMLSQNEAVFTRPGAEIFVSGVPPTLFQTKEMVVLAGRVVGNKGVISPLGSEALLPALDYVGAYKCGSACENF
jgi:uncharacterized protein YecT (DUF1311 family)